jgi:protein-S-isoprenylcysteine O-methyltransferase Ste14
MLAPRGWTPERFPICGAILGLIAGVLAIFVVRMPMRVFELSLPNWQNVLGVLLICALYYLLWMLVRAVYTALGEKPAAGN